MCGIAGIVNLFEPASNSSALISMTKSIINRGPDDEGYMLYNNKAISYHGDKSIQANAEHISTSIHQKFKIGFGFRQLKIIDLSNNSHQPMSDKNATHWVIFNGEIYNFKEIKRELISLGYTFFSNSDTEVLLNAYKEWSEKALSKFNGMFAFAIFDKIKNELFIARDRIGIKPLFYHQNKNQFIFGSTIKSIIDSKLYNPEINWNGLQENFNLSTAQNPTTCFQNIFALEPAHYLKINLQSNHIEKKQYWKIPTNSQDFSLSEKKATELIEEGLFNSIEKRLISDVNVGTFMSGGIDSTTVSVIASKYKRNIQTLTLGFKGHDNFNEVPQAKDTANLHNLNHHVSYTNPSEIIENLHQISLAYEEPFFHLSANFMLAKMASENNVKVVLSGLGGDELFGGYDVYAKLPLWLKLQKKKSLIKLLPNIHKSVKKAKQIANYNSIEEFYTHYYKNYNHQQIQKLFKTSSFTKENTIDKYYNNETVFTDNVEAISYYNLKSYIGNHQMRAVDRSTMAFSIEGRFPLLDHHFIETAFKIPTKFKIKNTVQKHVLRQVAKNHIAKSCMDMSKKGLSLPLKNWISNELKEFTYDHLFTLKNRSIFNNKEIDNIIQNKDETKIWQLVSTELWLQNFITKR